MRAVIAILLLLLTPALAQVPAATHNAVTERLLDALKSAPDASTAALLETHISTLWLNAGSPAVKLLTRRGLRELAAGDHKAAIEDFTDAVTLDPHFAEGYRQLAMARYAAGDTSGAIAALAEAVRNQPRDFLAYKTLTDIAVDRQDWKAAYAAWQKVMALDPMTPGGRARLGELKRKALGQEM